MEKTRNYHLTEEQNKNLEIKYIEKQLELKKQIASGNTSPTAPRLIELAQMFGTPEELQTYIDMIKELKNELGATTSVKPKKSGGGSGGNTYKSDLNAFITTLKNARKEMNKLTGEGDDKYLEKLAYLGKKVGIDLGAGFKATNEEIMRVVNQYKGKLEENDRIDLELSLITDNAEHQLDAFQNLAKDLWDRYENSKKLEGWGFIPDEGTTEEVMREIDQLENYLREKGLKEGNEQQLKLTQGVMEVKAVTKDQALKKFKERLREQQKLLDALGEENPFPYSFEIKVDKPERIQQIVPAIEKMPGVETAKFGQEVVQHLFQLTRVLRLGGILLIVMLAIATLFIISNTIRITVFARRREVSIMKFVGATNWFIRWPFLLEGMLMGFIGALIASMCLYKIYEAAQGRIYATLAFFPLLPLWPFMGYLCAGLVCVGTVIGAAGSAISLRKFLDV